MATNEAVRHVADLAEGANLALEEISSVRDGVFKAIGSADFTESNMVYIKQYPVERRSALEYLVEDAEVFRYPRCDLLEADDLFLVMEPATGRPLAHLLPIVCFPPIWWLKKSTYLDAIADIGSSIGRLHTSTSNGFGPLITSGELDEAFEAMELFEDNLSSSIVEQLKVLLEEKSTRNVIHSITHGDRSPHNIFFDGKEIHHIDSACKWRCSADDNASFLLGIRLMIRRLPHVPRSLLESFEEDFWKGYNSQGPTQVLDSGAVSTRYLLKCLKLLETYHAESLTLNSKLTRRLDLPIIIDEIQRTLQAIE